MSLNHNNYLTTLASERRQVATFQAATVQQQIDSLREQQLIQQQQVDLLLASVEKLIAWHNKEHDIIETNIDHITEDELEISASTNCCTSRHR